MNALRFLTKKKISKLVLFFLEWKPKLCWRQSFHTKGPFGYNLFLLKLKIENWKHCSKIIFKCVNNIVWPIFNEKLLKSEVCGSYEPYTDHWCAQNVKNHGSTVVNSTQQWWTVTLSLKLKRVPTKKKKNAKRETQTWIQTHIKGLFGFHLFCWNWKFFAESTVNKGKS